ncbi:hypothetical protein DFAR_2970003 [Desulfarculales bacterium]
MRRLVGGSLQDRHGGWLPGNKPHLDGQGHARLCAWAGAPQDGRAHAGHRRVVLQGLPDAGLAPAGPGEAGPQVPDPVCVHQANAFRLAEMAAELGQGCTFLDALICRPHGWLGCGAAGSHGQGWGKWSTV